MKSITLLILLAISTNLFSQNHLVVNTGYLEKSRKQKKIGLIMLGGGATLFLTGVLIPKGEVIHESFWGYYYKNTGVKEGFQLTGIVSMLGSIPLFIASSKNRKKASAISIRNEKGQALQKTGFTYKSILSVCITVRL